MNILPSICSTTPNYWCTWCHQGNPPHTVRPANANANEHIDENLIFNEEYGWANLYPEIRSELYFILDEGWDIAYDTSNRHNYHRYGALIPDGEKFPSFTGSPAERLTQLNEKIRSFGWKGTGLWVSPNCSGPRWNEYYVAPDPYIENYWRDRLHWCREAGIGYWKVDWGYNDTRQSFRRMMTNLGHEIYPELWIEHGRCARPYNGTGNLGNCRITQDEELFCDYAGYSSFSDVYRTYDATPFSVATTLDRIAFLVTSVKGILTCEDELYMGASLGCAFGIMRSTLGGTTGEEALAAVRWHRIAPAFGDRAVYTSAHLLTECCPESILDGTWFQRPDVAKSKSDGYFYQQAPAVIARRTALPEVKNEDDPMIAFVGASLNPTGAYSIGAYRRETTGKPTTAPVVVCRPEKAVRYIGIFGHFDDVTIDLSAHSPRITRIFAQCLIRGEAVDIMAQTVTDNIIRLPGALLESLNGASDKSAPGIMLEITYTMF